MTTDEERRRDDYLWDPSAEPAADVQDVERLLAPARFNAAERPLVLPDTSASRRYVRPLLAMAATLAIVGMGAFFGAVVRAPLTGIAVVIEMTAATWAAVPLLAATAAAVLVAELLKSPPIYDSLRERMSDARIGGSGSS